MTPTTKKGIAAAFLIAVWAFLVAIGKADAPSLIDTIKAALLLLSGHTIFNNRDSKP